MKKRSAVVAALCALAVGMVVVPQGGPVGAAGSISNLSMDAGPFTVSTLLETATTTISVDVDEPGGGGIAPSGVASCMSELDDGPIVGADKVVATLTRTSGGSADTVQVFLRLASGTRSSGTWSGDWRIGASRGGVWTITKLSWCYWEVGPDLYVTDRAFSVRTPVTGLGSRTVTVNASLVPLMTMARVPSVVSWGATQNALVTVYGSTGRPIVGRSMTVGGPEGGCGFLRNGGQLRVTNSRGQITLPAGSSDPTCVYLANPQLVNLGDFSGVTLLQKLVASARMYYRSVSIIPSALTLSAALPVTIRGAAKPTSGVARLQRLDSGTWVNAVDSVSLNSLGIYSFTLRRTAESRGAHDYRVVVSPRSTEPARYTVGVNSYTVVMAATASAVKTITGV